MAKTVNGYKVLTEKDTTDPIQVDVEGMSKIVGATVTIKKPQANKAIPWQYTIEDLKLIIPVQGIRKRRSLIEGTVVMWTVYGD